MTASPQILASILEPVVAAVGVTSMWVCQLEGPKHIVVVGEAMANNANDMEKVSDLYSKYALSKSPKLFEWIKSTPDKPLIFQINQMPANDLDRLEYFIHRVASVLFMPIYTGKILWGFLEVWDTQQEHHFDEAECMKLGQVCRTIEKHIVQTDFL